MNRYRQIARVVAVVIILGLIGAGAYGIYTVIYRNGKVALTVQVVPKDAKITANDTVIKTGTSYLLPGEYKISISEDGFSNYEQTINLKQDPVNIDVALEPQSEAAKKWARENHDAYLPYEVRAGQQAVETGEQLSEQHPIVNKLPYRNLLFTIGYKSDPASDDPNAIIIEIDAPEGYRSSAINQISDWGYNPAELNINFRSYQNPFAL